MNSKRSGEPEPIPVRTPGVARLMSAAPTWDGVRLGFSCSNRAAAPATCGVAIEVPSIVFVAVLLVYQAEVIEEPGANISTQGPKLENQERAPEESIAATV